MGVLWVLGVLKMKSFHKVRSYECDFYGHVNNAIYLHYLEWGRFEFLEQRGISLEQLKKQGYVIVIANLEIRYLRSARTGDDLAIETILEELHRCSGVFLQNIYLTNDGTPIARAKVRFCFTDFEGKPVSIPSSIHNSLKGDSKGETTSDESC
ncbi:MAG: acyl-CoA thioesterase [Planctomycetota bacterium]|nr:MAG: acyl-CoA thioesterase [Planctomycetota bacterium]